MAKALSIIPMLLHSLAGVLKGRPEEATDLNLIPSKFLVLAGASYYYLWLVISEEENTIIFSFLFRV